MKKHNISVIGAGYVGLITGACLSKFGNKVIFVDKDKNKIRSINNGKDPINEPYLEKIIYNSRKKELIYATNDLQSAIFNTDITFIAVDTPSKNKKIDLRQIKSVIIDLSKALLLKNKKINKKHFIVIKSTVLPGTTNYIKQFLKKKLGKNFKNIEICSNPEFLRQGYAVKDFLNPDRIVIGSSNQEINKKMSKIYSVFHCPIIITSFENSELIKYVSNVFLANLISFSNQVSILCNYLPNTDVKTILKGLHLDKRLSIKYKNKIFKPKMLDYINAGSGYGGSCLPKDVKAINQYLKKKRIKAPLFQSIEDINNEQPSKVIKHFKKKLGNILNMKIAVLGISFKGDSDDLRDSPAINIIRLLKKEGAKLKIWDPYVNYKAVRNFKIIGFSNNLNKVVYNADCIFIATAIKKITSLNWKKISHLISKKNIYDSRNFLDKDKVKKYFNYYHIGS